MSKQAGTSTAAATTMEGLEAGGRWFVILVRQLLVSLHVQVRMSVQITRRNLSSRHTLTILDVMQSTLLVRALQVMQRWECTPQEGVQEHLVAIDAASEFLSRLGEFQLIIN